MALFQPHSLNRNSKKISSYFVTNNNIVSTKEDIVIIYPKRYVDIGLAFAEEDIRVIGIFAIIDKQNNYATCSAPIFLTLTPSNIDTIEVNDKMKDYIRLTFPKDTVVISNTSCIMTDNFLYEMFNDFYSYARIPFFLNYDDVSMLFSNVKEYTGASLGNSMLTFELIASVMARQSKDKRKFLRFSKDKEDVSYVGLKDVIYSYNNTGAKLFGNYLAEGINSAIIEDETRSSKTTEILRR